MRANRTIVLPWRQGKCGLVMVCHLLVLLLIGTLGCDNRISLQEFLKMQKQPTTQPSSVSTVKMSRLNQYLGPYRVGPSDVLEVSVIGPKGEALPPVRVRVWKDGTIELPLVGEIKVSGMVLEDVEKAIRKAYLEKVYKQAVVHVELLNVDTVSVLVTGAVESPGLVHLRRNERDILHAIVAAKGISSAASGRVTLCRIRDSGKKVTYDLTKPEELKAALALDPLENGDIITAQAATPNTIFVGGLVKAPRPQTYPPGVRITVLQAIAAAAGLRTDVLPREATLIRRMPNGKDVHVKLDLNRIATGKDPNIALAPGDILWVPHTLETRIQEWISRNISIHAGASASLTYDFYHTKDILYGRRTTPSVFVGGSSPPPAGP